MAYAYTLQGWLKEVDGILACSDSSDIGGDGFGGSLVARDAFGFALHYYGSKDYYTISATVKPFAEAGAAGFGYKLLYNGNISGMSVNLPAVGTPLLYTYTYDQLNRLTKMFTYSGLNTATNTWAPVTTQDFRETVSYDPNGNIGTYVRNGNTAASMPLAMDDLGYRYYYTATNGTRKTYDPLAALPSDVRELSNRLAYVTDAVAASNYAADVDNQPVNNYDYDEIGNLIKDSAEGIATIDWTVYGKIANIKKANGLSISYTYDAAGNRISKSVYTPTTDTTAITWYVRDASGNVMAVYRGAGPDTNPAAYSLRLQEQHLYGSSRLGVWNRDVNMKATWNSPDTSVFLRGMKRYELTNHLGNVLAVVSDRRTGVDSTSDGNVDYYTAQVISAQDYYPFGMLTPERTYTGGTGYRYGFNGKENDGVVKGEGNSYDFGARINDPRIGRWMSVDPLFSTYPHQSPYVSMSNNPLNRIDPTGMGDYYSQDGKHLGSDGKKIKGAKGKMVGDDKAYVTSQDMINKFTKDGNTDWDAVIGASGTSQLSVSNSTLGQYANAVANESSGDMKESFALASTVKNLAEHKGKDILTTLKTEGIYGYNGKASYTNAEYGIAAAINALSGGTDYSNGAIRWDGFDLAAKGFSHVKPRVYGVEISAENFAAFEAAWPDKTIKAFSAGKYTSFAKDFSGGMHTATQGENTGRCLLLSTAVHGRTMFWGINKDPVITKTISLFPFKTPGYSNPDFGLGDFPISTEKVQTHLNAGFKDWKGL